MLHRIVAAVLIAHGLIHLLGFAVYWSLAEVEGLPYPDSFLNGRIDAPTWLVRLLGGAWLAVAVAVFIAAVGLLFGRAWWTPLLIVAVLASLALCALAWPEAQAGVVLDLVILLALAVRQIHPVRWSFHRPHAMSS
jgi:hypothetical protein